MLHKDHYPNALAAISYLPSILNHHQLVAIANASKEKGVYLGVKSLGLNLRPSVTYPSFP